LNDLSRIEPLQIASASSLAADRIRQGIVEGTFAQGSRIGEAELSRQLSVSRGPVREAMQRLIQEGLLRAERNRGVFVVDLGLADIEDIYAARAALEYRAVRLVLEGGRAEEHTAALGAIVETMSDEAVTGDWSRIADLDLEFHEVLVAGTESPRMIRMYRTLAAETRICLMQQESAYSDNDDLVEEHKEIVDALRTKDADRALAAVDAHFAIAIEILVRRNRGDASASVSF
jgi:DNA-binding GntR family transcriptional regulator